MFQKKKLAFALNTRAKKCCILDLETKHAGTFQPHPHFLQPPVCSTAFEHTIIIVAVTDEAILVSSLK
jgi:hypothetical protein